MATKNPEVRYKRILALGKDCVGALNTALAAGTSTIKLAQRIQNEWDALTNMKTATLAKQLTRYRADMIPKLVVAVRPGTGAVVEYLQPPAFDALDVLREGILIQRERVRLGHAQEQRIQFPIPSMCQEMRLLADMATALMKCEFELGLREYKGPIMQYRGWYR
jgi:hypothetical protein